MKLFGAVALGVGAVMMAPIAEAMSQYRWKSRPLVVFAPGEGNASLVEQRRIVAQRRSGFAERDMVIVWVVGDKVLAELGRGPGQSASSLRARYGVSGESFRAILVGKDGGSKLTSSTPLTTARLFGTIDAMPMRRDEMRGR